MKKIEFESNFIVEHLGKKTQFFKKPFGDYTYQEILTDLQKTPFRMASFGEIVSLVNYIEFFQKPYQGINSINWGSKYYCDEDFGSPGSSLVGATGALYIPGEGVFVEDFPKIKNNKLSMNKRSLLGRIKSKDPLVRFVRLGFKTEEQTSYELSNNPLIKAVVGNTATAKKIAKISSDYSMDPILFSSNEFQKETSSLIRICFPGGIDSPQLEISADGSLDEKRIYLSCPWLVYK